MLNLISKPDRPALVVIAGPNGSGKSSAYSNARLQWEERSIWINNPDLLTVRLETSEQLPKLEANLEAVQRIEKWLYSSIDVHQTIGVETVLSTDKYRKLVVHAQKRGFDFWLIYVILDSPEECIERVKIRTEKGGHFVPPSKIISRYWRSLEQLPWFLKHANRAWVFNNSGPNLKTIIEKSGPSISVDPTASNKIKAAIETIWSI